MNDSPTKQIATLVSQLLRSDYIRLLYFLPDSFFSQSEQTKHAGWQAILSAINRGETDPEKLASLPEIEDVKVLPDTIVAETNSERGNDT